VQNKAVTPQFAVKSIGAPQHRLIKSAPYVENSIRNQTVNFAKTPVFQVNCKQKIARLAERTGIMLRKSTATTPR
jgi:hypothetical protein